MGSRSKKNKKKKWEHIIAAVGNGKYPLDRNIKDIDNNTKHKSKGSR